MEVICELINLTKNGKSPLDNPKVFIKNNGTMSKTIRICIKDVEASVDVVVDSDKLMKAIEACTDIPV